MYLITCVPNMWFINFANQEQKHIQNGRFFKTMFQFLLVFKNGSFVTCVQHVWLVLSRYLACLSSSSSNDKLAFDVGLQEQSEGEILYLPLAFE